jgi:hypothetical protein
MTMVQYPNATTRFRELIVKGVSSRMDLVRELMALYSRPLAEYFQRSSYRSLAEPDDIVHGFLVGPMLRDGYLDRWLGSGKRLRHWLSNGLLFHCKDVRNEQRRQRGQPLDDADPPAQAPAAQQALDRGFTSHLVRVALQRAKDASAAKGQLQHWDLFERYRLRAVPIESLAREHALSAERVRVKIKTAQRAFVAGLRDAIAADLDSATPDDIDRELRLLAEEILR